MNMMPHVSMLLNALDASIHKIHVCHRLNCVVLPEVNSPSPPSPFLPAAVMRPRLVDLALSWSPPGTRLCKRLQLRTGMDGTAGARGEEN